MQKPMRSWMFVPGNKQRFLDKCADLPVDGVLLDLEDGVAISTKELARTQIAQTVARGGLGPIAFLRTNPTDSQWFQADLAENVHANLAGVLLPKMENPDDVREVSSQLGRLEAAQGISIGHTKIMLAIESAKGLLNSASLAAADERVMGLILGSEDLALDMGLAVLREGEASELLYARSVMVTAARSAGVAAIDGVYPDFEDLDGLRQDAGQARRLGFTGKSLFHPGQIEEVNALFSPSESELAHARTVIEAFEAAVERGDGAVAVRGQLVDLPIVRRAERMLEAYEQFNRTVETGAAS